MADQDDQQPLDTTNPDNENVAFDLWDDPFYSIFDDDQFGPTALPNIHSSPTSNVDIASPLNPMEDPLPWEFHDDLCESIRETLDDSGDNLVNEDEDNTQHTNTDFVNTMPLAVWPPLPVPFSCSCCQVLREIIYCNGTQIARLEIHGRVGIICHAIKEIRNNFDNLAPTVEYVMIDFTTHSIENVKRYLIQYCQEQRQAGYVMTRDPLSAFYDALCAGQNWDESNIDTDDYLQDFQTQTGQEEENEENRLAKSGLAAQLLLRIYCLDYDAEGENCPNESGRFATLFSPTYRGSSQETASMPHRPQEDMPETQTKKMAT
ncbi:hypothetical protein NE237_027334 [Protea cynaroides]|uniref:Uncharacterized protein n=1 Tax=Protea cynaroides TaxID=273540 RepID=A0A9Q0GR51_9MAGN|nr:hypothetical protein NE237_027334 [Protea cynaroides]